jgi:hypothetical protein
MPDMPDMYADARAARDHLRLDGRLERAARVAVEPAPSLSYDDFPREVPKREVRVNEAAQRIANALHLHLD